MANIKSGLAFYRTDTDRYQDIRIKRLKKSFGCMGVAVYDYVLCEIYRVRGCFIEWDENTAFDVAEYFDLKETQVNEVITYCCVVGLFNKGLLASGRVLTSESIQKRYIEICMRAKRKEIIIPEEYRITPEECTVTPEEYQITPEVCNKEKKRKEKNIDISPNGEDATDYEALIEFFNRETKGVFGNVRYPITGKREGAIRARIREHGKEAFALMIQLASKSDFLKGNNQRGFTATFDWLIKPDNFQKIIEGNYENRRRAQGAAGNAATDKPSAKAPRDYSQRF
jgi:hypothetical protein